MLKFSPVTCTYLQKKVIISKKCLFWEEKNLNFVRNQKLKQALHIKRQACGWRCKGLTEINNRKISALRKGKTFYFLSFANQTWRWHVSPTKGNNLNCNPRFAIIQTEVRVCQRLRTAYHVILFCTAERDQFLKTTAASRHGLVAE